MVASQLGAAERILAIDTSLDNSWVWFLTSHRLLLVRRSDGDVRSAFLDLIRSMNYAHGRLTVVMQDHSELWIKPSVRSDVAEALYQRLLAMPRFTSLQAGTFGDHVYSYFPWRPRVPASWRIEHGQPLLPGQASRLRQQVRNELIAVTDRGQVPSHVALEADPRKPTELLAKAIVHDISVNERNETLEPSFAKTQMIQGRDFSGHMALVIAGDFGLYVVDPIGPVGWMGVGYPDLPVTPALYADIRDWQDWEIPTPEAQRFVFRLSIQASDSDNWLLMLLGLPIDEHGLAVRDRIVAGVLAHSEHVDPRVSVLGRDTTKAPIPVAWKQ
jgi:hypothetical protein